MQEIPFLTNYNRIRSNGK